MRGFDYYKVTTVAQAISLLTRYQEKAAILAGGSDLLARMKDRLEGPKLQSASASSRYHGDQGTELHQGAEERVEDRCHHDPERYRILSSGCR